MLLGKRYTLLREGLNFEGRALGLLGETEVTPQEPAPQAEEGPPVRVIAETTAGD